MEEVLDVATNAMTDTMVERLISSVSTLAEISDAIASSKLLSVIDKLSKNADILESSLDSVFGLLSAINTLNNAFSDTMIERLVVSLSKIAELTDYISNSQLIEVVEKIAKNADTLNKSIDSIIGFSNALVVMDNAFTDSMLERIVSFVAELGELTDELRMAELKSIIPMLSTLAKDGAMEALIDTAKALVTIRNALSDSMLERVASIVVDTIDYFASLRAQSIGSYLLESINQTTKEFSQKEQKPSIFGVLKELKEPQTLQSIMFMLALIKNMPQGLAKATGCQNC
ncbi:helical membrane plugin domain-containing protein [Hydrogenobaculum acidophilum]